MGVEGTLNCPSLLEKKLPEKESTDTGVACLIEENVEMPTVAEVYKTTCASKSALMDVHQNLAIVILIRGMITCSNI